MLCAAGAAVTPTRITPPGPEARACRCQVPTECSLPLGGTMKWQSSGGVVAARAPLNAEGGPTMASTSIAFQDVRGRLADATTRWAIALAVLMFGLDARPVT